MMRTSSFNKCLNKIRKGNPQGLEDIYYAYYEKIKQSTLIVIKDRFEAEDIASKVLKLILEKINRIPYIRKPNAWMAKISHDLLIDYIREKSKTVVVDVENIRINVISEKDEGSSRLQFEEALLTLTDIEKRVLVLHYMYGYKYREISRILYRPVGSIKSDISKIKGKLKHLKNRDS